jgi:hypothetical protein
LEPLKSNDDAAPIIGLQSFEADRVVRKNRRNEPTKSKHQHDECCLMVARHLQANGSYCTTEAKAAVAELNALGLNYTLSKWRPKAIQGRAWQGQGRYQGGRLPDLRVSEAGEGVSGNQVGTEKAPRA